MQHIALQRVEVEDSRRSHGLLFQFPGAPEDMVLWQTESALGPQDSTVF